MNPFYHLIGWITWIPDFHFPGFSGFPRFQDFPFPYESILPFDWMDYMDSRFSRIFQDSPFPGFPVSRIFRFLMNPLYQAVSPIAYSPEFSFSRISAFQLFSRLMNPFYHRTVSVAYSRNFHSVLPLSAAVLMILFYHEDPMVARVRSKVLPDARFIGPDAGPAGGRCVPQNAGGDHITPPLTGLVLTKRDETGGYLTDGSL
jgi:hypothetical protein